MAGGGAGVALDRLTGEHGALFIRSEQLFDWARRNSLWYLMFGIACCAIEMMHAGGPRFDFDRFGIFHRGSPRQSDVMIVAGTVNTKMAHSLRRLYEQMPEPKWVVAMGACASTGGPFREYPNVVLGVDAVVPVDVYVPGCPPRPEALQYGFMRLQELIRDRTEERLARRRSS
ncbi:MAG: NADH-quinone oxidoreductase subunit B [Coriobacteriia bacterium]|nr:NADH-quinone oxidoreductase subunit B [Coriobacteriia bacterium]